jgi:proteic killer suppression protein
LLTEIGLSRALHKTNQNLLIIRLVDNPPILYKKPQVHDKELYTFMIKSFIHKGLERFYRSGSSSGIQAKHTTRLRLILSNLDQAESVEDMDLPGLVLHELKGNRKGIWAVKVSGNWRVTFRFIEHDAEIVNYEDYH